MQLQLKVSAISEVAKSCRQIQAADQAAIAFAVVPHNSSFWHLKQSPLSTSLLSMPLCPTC
jgi:hypothetical protein